MKLLCFDGNSVMNRAFYAVKLLTTKDGRHTGALYGFINIFLKVLTEQRPDAVAVAFDLPAPTFRHLRYTPYKATRKGMPPELREQMPLIKELLTALGYRVIGLEGYEADDLLGTFSAFSEKNGWNCVIATGDRDSLQLVSARTSVLLTTTQFGRGETALVDEEKIRADYGVTPRQLIEVKALMGDSSDNVPGVSGIGETTALALIRSFGSVDGVYENIDSPMIKPGVRTKLLGGRETAYLSRELVTIFREAPIPENPGDYKKQPGDGERARAMLASLEMHSLLPKLALNAPDASSPAAGEENTRKNIVGSAPLQEGVLTAGDRVFLYVGAGGILALKGEAVYTVTEQQAAALLADKRIEKWSCDTKALFHFAMERGVEAENLTFDLSLAAYLLNPSSPSYDPARIAAEYGVLPLFEYEEQPAAGLLQPLSELLTKKLEETGMLRLFREIELPLAKVLAEMERAGFLVNTDGIRSFGEMLAEEMAKEQAAISEMVGYTFNINSPKQLGEALFQKLGLPAGRRTKSGFSTDAEVLDKLRGHHPVIGHILRFRSCQKLYSTYVEGLLKAAGADGRVHTDFKQTETRTGRISSTHPNLQNIPIRTELGSRLRKYFIAGDGHLLLDADYSQIELRVLASVSGDERMTDAFLDGRDIHTDTASEIFKLPRSLITPEFRRRAKAVNFGIVYGIGSYSLAEDVGVSMSEANDYIEGYLATYGGVRAYLEQTVENAKRDGYVTTLFGRRRMLPELLNSNRTVQALGRRLAMNTPIQGTAADIIKIAMIRVSARLKAEKLRARLILQVHDELIVEVQKQDAKRASEVLREEMEHAAALSAPLEASVGEGENWYDAK